MHGITDADVAGAPPFVELAGQLFCLLDDAVFVAHNAPFDLAMLRHGLARVDVLYRPAAVACTLDAFRLIEPLADTTGSTRSARGTGSCSPGARRSQ